MLKKFTAIIVLAALGLCVIGYFNVHSFRNAGLISAQVHLRDAQFGLSKFGSNANPRVSLSTNVVVIGGTQYHCFIESTDGKLYGLGKVALTTNQVLIWLDARKPPRIIDRDYRFPLFPIRF
jgi:hypothetical protein